MNRKQLADCFVSRGVDRQADARRKLNESALRLSSIAPSELERGEIDELERLMLVANVSHSTFLNLFSEG